ncbi:MAG: hypothetical protein F4X44_00835 [Gammaproteobacteria bacterium]|nr:hypothetical protein [Gammaproteobacteria bacterium]MYD79148.1 hypothetical protein [Gammaproteobacteria bacterium]
MTKSLSEEIGSWDRKSAVALQSVYERYCADEDFVSTILTYITQEESQRAATWLLKKHLETGNTLAAAECRIVISAVIDQDHWESKLHLLQCLPYLDIHEDDCVGLESFLNASIRSENKFIRAWAYNGFNELALSFPRYRKKVDGMLAHGIESEAASVRARIRNILKNR